MFSLELLGLKADLYLMTSDGLLTWQQIRNVFWPKTILCSINQQQDFEIYSLTDRKPV